MANRERTGVPGVDRAYQNVLKWLARGEWEDLFGRTMDEHLGEACEELGLGPDELAEGLGEDVFGVAMGCAVDDLLTRSDDEGRNVVDDYLRRRGWRENAPGRRYLQALRDSVMSLYEVVEVAPGGHLVLRDLVRGGGPLRVDDRVGSESAVLWDRIAARVVEVAGKRVLGAGMLPFEFEAAEAEAGRVRDACRRGEEALEEHARGEGGGASPPPRGVIEEVILGHWAPRFTRAWLAAEVLARDEADEAGGGEPLVMHAVRLPLLEGAAATEAVVARLDAAAPTLVRGAAPADDGAPSWSWPAPPAAAEEEEEGEGARREEGEAESAGIVELGGDAVVLLTSSAGDAERGRELLAGLLAGLVGAATVDRFPLDPSPAEEDGEEAEAEDGGSGAAGPPGPATAGMTREALTEELAAVTDEIYRRLLGEPQAELGDVTPREAAAAGEEGRARLVTWLKRLENEDAHGARSIGLPAYDFRWMWAELGVADRRR